MAAPAVGIVSVKQAASQDICTKCEPNSWRHQRSANTLRRPPCQYTRLEKIRFFLARGIVVKVPTKRKSWDDNEEYLLSNAETWFEYAYIANTTELDQLMADFPQHLATAAADLAVFRSSAYLRWLFSVGASERAMQTIAQHKIVCEEDVVAACIRGGGGGKTPRFAIQLIRNPAFQLAEKVVVPVEIASHAELVRLKAKWDAGARARRSKRKVDAYYASLNYDDYYEGDRPQEKEDEEDEEFSYYEWEQLPVAREAKRLARIAGSALAAAVQTRDFQVTTELLVKGARANDTVWFVDPNDDAKPSSSSMQTGLFATHSFVSTGCTGRGLFKGIIADDRDASFDDKKVWVGLLAQFGVHFDFQYFSIIFSMVMDVYVEHERRHWLDMGAKHGANAFSHHLTDAMRHPLALGYVQWWHDRGFPCISKNDIYLRGSTIARLPAENRALMTKLFGLVFPKQMDSHALDLKPMHEVGGECTCHA